MYERDPGVFGGEGITRRGGLFVSMASKTYVPGHSPLDQSVDDWPYQSTGPPSHNGPGHSL